MAKRDLYTQATSFWLAASYAIALGLPSACGSGNGQLSAVNGSSSDQSAAETAEKKKKKGTTGTTGTGTTGTGTTGTGTTGTGTGGTGSGSGTTGSTGGTGSSTGGTGGGSGGVISIIVEPSDAGAALIAAINGATESVHMTMYELTDAPILDALLSRAAAGVDVKVILNETFPFGGTNYNTKAFSALQAANVPVVWASSAYTFTHEKCVVIDGNVAWIMTMNSATSSLVDNREYLAIDPLIDDIDEAEAQFTADFAGTPYTPSGNLLMSPLTMRPGLENLINSAQKTLNFEVEEISDAALTTDLCNAVSRGVTVQGVIASTSASSTQQAAVAQLQKCGATIVSLATPYIHAKAIVVDDTQMYVGSANYTSTSIDQNRELGLVTSTASAVSPVSTQVAADIAAGTTVSY